MKKVITFFFIAQIILCSLHISSLYAWRGESSWDTISRETIIKIADEMVDFTWGPMQTITNWNYGTTWYTFNRPGVYRGEAYSQTGYPYDDQANWSDFTNDVYYTTGGTTYYGNDCSGFVSISWKLPTRYNTTDFSNDATTNGGYVTKLGAVGSSKNVSLIRGDALVKSGSHIILFEGYSPNGTGIYAIEQTSVPSKGIYWAIRSQWTWSQLSNYRPIRRNNLTEDNYMLTAKWGNFGSGDGEFVWPTDIAVDSVGNVYVADNIGIQKFTGSGGFIKKWGVSDVPYGIAVDLLDNLYVTLNDYQANNVMKFTNNGDPLTSFETLGAFNCDSTNHGNTNIYGISVSPSGDIYLTLSIHYTPMPDYDAVRRFNSSGRLLNEWGKDCEITCSIANGKVCYAMSIAVDNQSGKVYVADTLHNRIQKFTNTGSFVKSWGNDETLDQPYGIAVDLAGDVYVADTYNHRIKKFDSDGTLLTKWGSNGTGDSEFQYPYGLDVDSKGNVYVADTANSRIQKFSPVSPQPSAPAGLAAARASSSSINLTWQDNSNSETGFKIIRKTTYMGLYETIATVGPNVTSYTDSGLTYAMQYFYAISAFNSNGESAYSNEAMGGTY